MAFIITRVNTTNYGRCFDENGVWAMSWDDPSKESMKIEVIKTCIKRRVEYCDREVTFARQGGCVAIFSETIKPYPDCPSYTLFSFLYRKSKEELRKRLNEKFEVESKSEHAACVGEQ